MYLLLNIKTLQEIYVFTCNVYRATFPRFDSFLILDCRECLHLHDIPGS